MQMEEQIVLTKYFLSAEECCALVDEYSKKSKQFMSMLGEREYVEMEISAELIAKITTLLSNYVVVNQVPAVGRIYHTITGTIKEHQDAPVYDSVLQMESKYTLIIYLSSTEDGHTRIKRDGKRICVKPSIGFGVLFNHYLFHDAVESSGDKYILLLKIF